MIERIEAWKASDGTLHKTERDAQKRDIYLTLQLMELAQQFTHVENRIHSSSRMRGAIYTLADELRALYPGDMVV